MVQPRVAARDAGLFRVRAITVATILAGVIAVVAVWAAIAATQPRAHRGPTRSNDPTRLYPRSDHAGQRVVANSTLAHARGAAASMAASS
jgi:hypothetical protein